MFFRLCVRAPRTRMYCMFEFTCLAIPARATSQSTP
jgi:hypothetical protein